MLIDKYYSYLKNNKLNKVVIAPESMIIPNSEDDEGWVAWKPAKSNITADKIEELELKFDFEFPKDYINFINIKQSMDIQIGDYTLYGINELNTLEKLALLFPPNIISSGFFPIGSINDGDYLALEAKTGNIIKISLDDYSEKEKLFDGFSDLKDYLSNQTE